MTTPATTPDLPRLIDTVREASVGWDMRGLWSLMKRTSPRVTDAPPVIVFPGLWSSDSRMWIIHRFLRRAGYSPEGWGLGFNNAGRGRIDSLDKLSARWPVDRLHHHNGEAEVPHLVDLMVERVKTRADREGRPIALVGHSLGGFIAREVARDLPYRVSQVITLGSPAIGGPRYTRARGTFERRGYDFDWVERVLDRRAKARPIRQPVTSVYSKRDGVVGWQASLDHRSPNVTHHEVDCSHLALPAHAPSLEIVHAALSEHTA